MSQEEQGKKTSPTEKLPTATSEDNKVIVSGEPADALTDADLDKVAGGLASGTKATIGTKTIIGPSDLGTKVIIVQ